MNWIDAAVVIMSIVELCFTGVSGGSTLTAFRSLRVFRIIRMLRTFRVLRVGRLVKSLKSF